MPNRRDNIVLLVVTLLCLVVILWLLKNMYIDVWRCEPHGCDFTVIRPSMEHHSSLTETLKVATETAIYYDVVTGLARIHASQQAATMTAQSLVGR